MSSTIYNFQKKFYFWDRKKGKSTYICSELRIYKNLSLVVENKELIEGLWCIHSLYIPGRTTYEFTKPNRNKEQQFYLLGKEIYYGSWNRVRKIIKGFQSRKANKYKFENL